MKRISQHIIKILTFTYKKPFIYIKYYFSYIYKNIGCCVLNQIDTNNLNVLLYTKSTRSHVLYNLHEIIYDYAIISSLTSIDASKVGFYYGLNYNIMTSKKRDDHPFLITTYPANKYNLLSIDRRRKITFSTNQKATTKNLYMTPEDVFNSKNIINGFHPIQACYIGMLAGMNIRSKKTE